MTIEDLKNAIEDGNDVYFTYKGVDAGLESTVIDGVATYDVWYGNDERSYDNLDDALSDPFYDGYSISELLDENATEIRFS